MRVFGVVLQNMDTIIEGHKDGKQERANRGWCRGVTDRAHALHAITVCSGTHAAVMGASACVDLLLVVCEKCRLVSQGSDSASVPVDVALRNRRGLRPDLMWNNMDEEYISGDQSL